MTALMGRRGHQVFLSESASCNRLNTNHNCSSAGGAAAADGSSGRHCSCTASGQLLEWAQGLHCPLQHILLACLQISSAGRHVLVEAVKQCLKQPTCRSYIV